MRPSLRQLVARFRRLRPASEAGAQVAIEWRAAALMAARTEGGRLVRTLHQPCRPDQRREQLERMRRADWFEGAQVYLLLGTSQRQLTSTPRPAVPDAELRDALRWQLRDALDYPPEEAVLDPLPVASTEPSGREEVLVFSVRRGELAPMIRPFVEAGIKPARVAVIDCAQRNLARHWVAQAGVTALLVPCAGGLLCTVSRGEELILSRAMEVEPELTDGSDKMAQAAERIALQLQRTLDLLERRSADAAVTALVVADWGPAAPLLRRVASLAGPRAMALPLDILLGPDEAPASVRPEALHEFIHLLGACLMDPPTEAPGAALRPFETGEVDVADDAIAAPADATPAVAFVETPGFEVPPEPAPADPLPLSPEPVIETGLSDRRDAAVPDDLPVLELPRRRADESADPGASQPAASPRASSRSGATTAVPRRAAADDGSRGVVATTAAPSRDVVPVTAAPSPVVGPGPRRAAQAAAASPGPTAAGSFLLVDPADALAAELARSVASSRPANAPALERADPDRTGDDTAGTPAADTVDPTSVAPMRLELLP